MADTIPVDHVEQIGALEAVGSAEATRTARCSPRVGETPAKLGCPRPSRSRVMDPSSSLGPEVGTGSEDPACCAPRGNSGTRSRTSPMILEFTGNSLLSAVPNNALCKRH